MVPPPGGLKAELQKVLNVPSILKFTTEIFLKSAVIFMPGTNFSV